MGVYSSLPVLDLHSFLEAVAKNDPDANISLLLFQAVMFAGTAFVDLRHLQAAGFKTRKKLARLSLIIHGSVLFSGLMWNASANIVYRFSYYMHLTTKMTASRLYNLYY